VHASAYLEDGEASRENGEVVRSGGKGATGGVCRFAARTNDRDATEKGLSTGGGNPSRACLFARQDTVEGDIAEINPESDRDSPPGCPGFRSYDVASATASRPGDVLTDVLLKLTFDNTAYVEETSAGASTTGLLPDSL